MKRTNLLLTLMISLLFAGTTFAQGVVRGVVMDASNGETLIGTSVIIQGTTTGVSTNADGAFTLNVPAGTHTLIFHYLGYQDIKKSVTVKDGQKLNLKKIYMQPNAIGLAGVAIIADRAKERVTPVAFSNVEAKQLKFQLGSRDLPLIMNNTPSVYATAQGGGAGDSRINVRGFNQKNVAIMINGVPVNDMENGWVYWSNWDGIADATSSIQMQRGLSATNLATPSIGGTMNIITSPSLLKSGASGKFEIGSGSFFKTTLTGNTGLINNKFAMTVSAVRKVGKGVVDGTWTDAWAYYLAASYNINKNHRVEAYLVGAPQRHGQNLYKQNVAAYSTDFAKSIGADSAAANIKESASGRLYNENWSPVDPSYKGKQYWYGGEHNRYSSDFINERENFYHKPIANLNWYAQWSKKLSQFTTAYYSGGNGGGSGTYGHVKWDYSSEPSRIVDYNSTIANNTKSDTAYGILRNSVNNQWTIGVISKFKYEISNHLKLQAGIDWRTAKINHYREVRDLLGGQFYIYSGNVFDETAESHQKKLGDKIAYYNTNTVDWIGGFLQGEYSTEKVSVYGTYGYSQIKYSYTNHFKKDSTGNELFSQSSWISGQQIKGGISYRPLKTLSVFANLGYVTKVPIFDNVINDRDGTVAQNPANEKFTSYEVGALYKTEDGKLDTKINYYYTKWTDRALSKGVVNPDGSEGLIFLRGMNQLHKGLEIQAKYRINNLFGIGVIGSFANWHYTDDVSGEYKNYNPDTTIKYNFFVKDLKVGDAPQTQVAGWIDIYPMKTLQLQVIYRYNTNYYADWDPFSRTSESDRAQVWEVPSYGLLDFHFAYQIPLKGRVGVYVTGHMFNIMNTMYVSDAVDNSRYNGYYGYNHQLGHTANSAEVFVGLPRTYNLGVKITFN